MKKLLNQSGVIHTLPLLVIIAAVGIISFLLISSTAPIGGGLFGKLNPKTSSQAQAMMMDQCFFMNGAKPAFCDTFDTIHNGGRAGDLDPLKWTVFRFNSTSNPQQGLVFPFWPVAQAQFCTQLKPMQADHDSYICGAQFNEPNHWMTTMDDHGTYQYIGGRILQPFDFTNRTGTVVFDVDAKHAGSHTWWPEVWISADPDAMPHHNNTAANGATPKNGIGFQFGATGCIPGGNPANGVGLTPTDTHAANIGGIDEVDITRNYIMQDKIGGSGHCGIVVQSDHANHFEIRLSTTHVEVWASDPTQIHGQMGPNFKMIFASDINPPLPFSRGYVSMQHSQYNAGKERVDSQQTYHWHGVGFDGPVLPAQRDYPIPDSLGKITWIPEWNGAVNLGYGFSKGSQQTFTFNNVDLTNAKDAWFSFAFRGSGVGYPAAFQYSFNGKAVKTAAEQNPMVKNVGTPGYDGSTILVQVPFTDLVQGTNTVTLGPTTGDVGIVDIDLLVNPMDNAPISTSTPGMSMTPMPSGTQMPTSTPTSSPTPMASTIGYTTVGTQTDTGDANSMNGSKVTTGTTGANVTSVSVAVGAVDASPNNQYQLAIYTDGAGVPGTLVAKSGTGTLTANSWNTLPITATLAANTSYWLMYNTNGTNATVNNMKFSPASSALNAFSNTKPVFGTWPQTFGASTLSNNVFSIYAAVNTGSTPSPTPNCPKASLGDINCDNVINIFDYNILIGNFGKSGAGIQGDLNGDGVVNIFDYNTLVSNFGK